MEVYIPQCCIGLNAFLVYRNYKKVIRHKNYHSYTSPFAYSKKEPYTYTGHILKISETTQRDVSSRVTLVQLSIFNSTLFFRELRTIWRNNIPGLHVVSWLEGSAILENQRST